MLHIIIVNYNGGLLLDACLRSLYVDLGARDAMVWLVDNASTDESYLQALLQFPQLRTIANQRNLGFAAANNQVLRRIVAEETASVSDAILLLNPDVMIHPGALDAMLNCLESFPHVGMVGPRIVRLNGELDWPCRRSFKTPAIYLYKIIGLDRLFPRSRRFGRYYMRYLPEDQPTDVDAIIGACMLVRRNAIDAIGLLDERFYIYCEDEDWCWRAKQVGWQVRYHPAAVVTHVKGASTRQRKVRMIYEWHKAIWQFHRKHMADSYGWLTNALVYAGMAATLGMTLIYHIFRKLGYRAIVGIHALRISEGERII